MPFSALCMADSLPLFFSLASLNFTQNIKKVKKTKRDNEGHSKVAQVNLWVKLITCYFIYLIIGVKIQGILSKLMKCTITRTTKAIPYSAFAAVKNWPLNVSKLFTNKVLIRCHDTQHNDIQLKTLSIMTFSITINKL